MLNLLSTFCLWLSLQYYVMLVKTFYWKGDKRKAHFSWYVQGSNFSWSKSICHRFVHLTRRVGISPSHWRNSWVHPIFFHKYLQFLFINRCQKTRMFGHIPLLIVIVWYLSDWFVCHAWFVSRHIKCYFYLALIFQVKNCSRKMTLW